MLCDLKQLTLQKYNRTSAGIVTKSLVVDRDSGKTFVIQYPSFDLMMSDSSLSFRTDWNRLPLSKLIALLNCLLILQSLPQIGLEEATEKLEEIADFYSNRSTKADLPIIPASSIKGKLRAAQIRPPIVLEP